MIILQLKSTQNTNSLEEISSIIYYLYNKHSYKIRGHEIQQISSKIEKMTVIERAKIVSSFCSKHELDYLTYHAPFLVNGADFNYNNHYNDIKWYQKVADSILITIKEAEKVYSDANLKHKVVIVFHITDFVPKQDIQTLTKEAKSKVLEKSLSSLIRYLYNNNNYDDNFISNLDQDIDEQQQHSYCHLLAVENSYPKPSINSHQLIGLYHPSELLELNKKYNMNVTLDLSHYQIYLNYLLHGKGNVVGDIERQIYGSHITWKDCINILGNSLVQLHISDSKGLGRNGEGLPIKEGEMDIIGILNQINSLKEGKNIIQGTIELKEGHLYNGKLQKQSADWLLTNARN